MATDLLDYAQRLHIVKVYEPGNPSGVVTDKRLYDASLTAQMRGGPVVPFWQGARGYLEHGTVGSNSLAYLARVKTGDAQWVSAHYLNPKEPYTLYKLIPDGFGANHAGPALWKGSRNLNATFYGIEHENWQGLHPDNFTIDQYIKGALCYVYLSARDHIPDIMHVSHSQVALPLGRRSDPEAGNFDYHLYHEIIADVRADARIWAHWGLVRWVGRALQYP